MHRWVTAFLFPVLGQAAIDRPVLVANGNEDVMIPTYRSYALSQAIPQARLIIYPDSGHAFMFQYAEGFAAEVVRFLEADDPRLS